jgi:divalent metal cation (Fe/Co/Zn/Cd) transporter
VYEAREGARLRGKRTLSPTRMVIYKDVIEIRDRPFNRAVKFTVIYPDNMNVTNVKELAERAWRSMTKQVTLNGITVKIEAFKR